MPKRMRVQSLSLLVSLIMFCPSNCWGGEYSIKDVVAGADLAAKKINAMEVAWATSVFHGEYRHGITVSEVSRNNSSKALIDSSMAHVWMLRGNYLKLEGSSNKGVETVKCVNPEYAFALERRQPLNSWVIGFCEQHGFNYQVDNVVKRQSSALKGTLLASNYVNLLPLNEFLRKPGVELKIGVPRAEDRGRVRVEFFDPGADASLLAYTRGHFYCDPNNDWAIDELHGFKENVNGTSSVVECHRALEFGKAVNGFPTVKTCRNLFVRDGKWVWGSIDDIELDDAIPGKEDFYLSAYGYPEPVFKKRSLMGGWGWYVLGTVLFGCAVLLLRRRIYAK